MYFIDLHSKLILDALNLTTPSYAKHGKVSNEYRWHHLVPGTHRQILPQALELATYPVVRNLFSPFLFQFNQSLLKNRIRPYLLRFRFLESNSD
jgi:hypothetical protein